MIVNLKRLEDDGPFWAVRAHSNGNQMSEYINISYHSYDLKAAVKAAKDYRENNPPQPGGIKSFVGVVGLDHEGYWRAFDADLDTVE